MKKLTSILLTVCMCLSIGVMLTACGHEHTYSAEWSKDTTHHWHDCEDKDCTEVADKAEHTWNGGEVTTPATPATSGVTIFTCTVCGQTKTESLDYVMDQTIANRVYSLIFHNGIIRVETNRESKLLSISSFDFETMLPDDNDFIIKFVYNDNGKMTSVVYDDVAYAIGAYDEKSRPTVAAKGDESISFLYDDGAKTFTITLTDEGKSWTFDEYYRCIVAVIGSSNHTAVFDGNVGTITSDSDKDYYLATYESNLFLVKLESFDYRRDGSYELSYVDTLEYTKTGLCTQLIMEEYSGSTVVEDRGRTIYEYNADEKLVKMTSYYQNVGSNKPEEKEGEVTYEYDTVGRGVKETHYNDSGEITSVYEYEYDDNGKLVKKTETDRYGSVVVIEYEYDGNGKKSKKTRTRYNNGIISSTVITEYHSDDGRIETSISYSNGIETSRSVSEYDGNGKKSKETGTRYNDGIISSAVITEYHSDGGRIETRIYYSNGIEAQRNVSEYDGNGKLVKKTDICGYVYDDGGGMAETGMAETITRYYSDGSYTITNIYYDKNGEEINRTVNEYDQSGHNIGA